MRSGAAAAQAYVTQSIATMDSLSFCDGEARKMSVKRGNAASVVHHDGAAIAVHEISNHYRAIRGSNDPGAELGRDIYAAMERSEERRVGKECRSRWWAY